MIKLARPIGYYTDSRGKVRPITRRTSHRRIQRTPSLKLESRPKVAIGGGEVGRYLAFQSLGQPRRFKSFPGDVWGQKAKFFDVNSRSVLSNHEARVKFNRGEAVGYVSSGFVYSVVKDPEGREPSI